MAISLGLNVELRGARLGAANAMISRSLAWLYVFIGRPFVSVFLITLDVAVAGEVNRSPYHMKGLALAAMKSTTLFVVQLAAPPI
jgi:hypothetical protein